MGRALDVLRIKNHDISDEEYQAAQIAILLHDIGHGPFSHSLEFGLLPNISHEEIGIWMFKRLNKEFNGQLTMALQIFKGEYPRKFLNQLVASQLDIDRLDYLKRDSFFTGVQEGTIGSERIIKMLDLANDELVIEEKGMYSVENFLNARRLMYWQVYLHKAAVSADVMLVEMMKRARQLADQVSSTPALDHFLKQNVEKNDVEDLDHALEIFTTLDDSDIYGSMKFWRQSSDKVLKYLSTQLLDRKLFFIELTNDTPDPDLVKQLRKTVQSTMNLSEKDAKHLVKRGSVSNAAYVAKDQSINILMKSGQVLDVAKATDLPNIKAISKIVKKHYLCYPKGLTLQAN